ncbi:MCE family protein [bacterium]|nr:MCE family protein [bacterium]MBP5591515.1 MCE family protein [bacterium]
MQVTSAQKRRVAVFFIFGIFVLVGLAALLVGNRLLKREDCYFTRFEDISVAGLSEGSTVKFQGMNIGTVSKISVDKENTAIVEVGFCLKPGVPIKEGTKTQLGTIGITGLKFLELKGGGQGANIPVGGEIPSEKSGWDEITGKASVIAEKLESILNQFNEALKGVQKDDVEKIVKNVGGISTSLDELLAKNKKEISGVIKEAHIFMNELNGNMDNVKAITTNVRELTSKEGSLAKTLSMMEAAVSDFREDYKEANVQDKVDRMFGLVESTQRTVDTLQLTFERSTEKIDKSLDDLSDAMSNFSEFTRIIMENPSALFGGGNSDAQEDKK